MLYKNTRYGQSVRFFTAQDLVESRTFAEINAKLDMIFGNEKINAAIDDGARPTRRYVLANRYRADIEYSVRVRDYSETGTILKIVYKALRSEGPWFNPARPFYSDTLIQRDFFAELIR